MMYSASTICSLVICTFLNKHLLTLKIQRGNETCRFVCCFFHSQIFMFIIHGKIGTPNVGKILGILQLFRMIWEFIPLHTWEHHDSVPYIRHYFSKVKVSSRRIKPKEPIPKAYAFTELWTKQLFLDSRVVPHACDVR